MELDPVREADVGPFVASMELAIQAAEHFRDTLLEVETALDALNIGRPAGGFLPMP